MLEKPYKEELIAKAEKLSKSVIQERNWFKVKNYTIRFVKGKSPDLAFDCDCQWGFMRTQEIACGKNFRHYCSHVLAVIYYLVNIKKVLDKMWLKAIKGE